MNVQTFLRTIFGVVNEGVIAVAAADYRGYASQRYAPGMIQGEQTYFCISAVRDIPRARILSRQTQDLVATYTIPLDDVGTKVPIERVPLTPTVIIETSPGNYQYHYKLRTPVPPAQAAALLEAIAAAGLTDPGARRADRIVRLPGSLNVKYAEPWRARVTAHNPEAVYTYSELVVGLGVTVGDTIQTVQAELLEDPNEDPVYAWLASRGMVISGPNPRGWYAIHCPWEDEHSGEVDHGADYRPGHPGVYRCMHAHGGDVVDTASLVSWIEAQDPQADVGPIRRSTLVALARLLGPVLTAEAQDQGRSAAERLAALFRPLAIGPAALPDWDATATGAPSRSQATTAPRVHAVMRLIGMEARQNALTGQPMAVFPAIDKVVYDPEEDAARGALAALEHACARAGMRGANAVLEAFAIKAAETQYSPAAEWVTSKPWDGRSRLIELAEAFKMRDRSLERWRNVALRRWSIQVIAGIRNYERGPDAVMLPHCLVWQGEQRIGKSSMVRSLMPARFVTSDMSLHLDGGERDAVMRVTQRPICELAEIDSSLKRSDIAGFKNFLSTKQDVYRMPYARTEMARARQTSFIATVNPTGFLLDPTGDRRFWPWAVVGLDYQHTIDMQQYWAEAWQLQAAGEQWWLTAQEEQLHAQACAPHRAETDILFAVADLEQRRLVLGKDEWTVATTKEIARNYELKSWTSTYVDLSSALERAGFERRTLKGKRGWSVPQYGVTLTEAQKASFRLVGFE